MYMYIASINQSLKKYKTRLFHKKYHSPQIKYSNHRITDLQKVLIFEEIALPVMKKMILLLKSLKKNIVKLTMPGYSCLS